ncbi:MAG: hypothetical protein DCC49_02835 [Acidobacteria bacterium]|nr:MAG: hypothetical protein DCC49_02835 [Acidobacteriota bacterium]
MSRDDAQEPARTKEDLDTFVQAFHYETEMLLSQGLLYLDHGREIADDRSEGKQVVADALLDSILNRLRAFDAFFDPCGKRVEKTDAIASDMANRWESRPTLRSETRKNINVRLSHLTYIRPREHAWEIGIMIGEALEAIRDFMHATLVSDESRNQLLKSVESTLDDWGDRNRIHTSQEHGHAFRA